jgi:hypothetical protein
MPVNAGDTTEETGTGTLAFEIAEAFLSSVPEDQRPDVKANVDILAQSIADAIAKAVNNADADGVLTG